MICCNIQKPISLTTSVRFWRMSCPQITYSNYRTVFVLLKRKRIRPDTPLTKQPINHINGFLYQIWAIEIKAINIPKRIQWGSCSIVLVNDVVFSFWSRMGISFFLSQKSKYVVASNMSKTMYCVPSKPIDQVIRKIQKIIGKNIIAPSKENLCVTNRIPEINCP